MYRNSTTIILALATLLFVSNGSAQQASTTAIPNLIRYSGTLKDANGAPILATTGVTFAIYKQQDGGGSVWMETQNVTPDASGQYSVVLGSTTATGLPSDLFSQEEQRWLGVQVQGQSEQPRVLLVSVPYAFKAHEAETLAGKSISDFVLAKDLNPTNSAAETGSDSTPAASGKDNGQSPSNLAASAGPTNFSGSTTDQIVGVTQSGTGAGVNAAAPGNAVLGTSTASTGSGYGVEGLTHGSSGTGVLGSATSTTGATIGVKGSATSTSGTGVLGMETATTGSTTGISSSVASPSGIAAVFNNTAGGKILSGRNNSVEKFSVDGSGNVTSSGRFTGSGSGLTGILFSQLGGTLASSQLSGTYSNALTLSNTSNIFYGNGAHLTGIVVGAGSPYYIQNGTAQQSSANFNISGNGTTGGTLSANIVNTATSYQIGGGGRVLSIGRPSDGNLFLGVNAGASNVAGSGVSNTFSGWSAGFSNTTAPYNTFYGFQAGAFNTTGCCNTFSGYQAGEGNTTGSNDTYIGLQAGFSNTTGAYNVFSGRQAGYSNTTGSNNTFSGNAAGYFNTTGYYNTFYGNGAGYHNTTGYDNTFSGLGAGYNNTTGYDNTFSGLGAGYNNTIGRDNTFSGYQAGNTNTTGSSNTFSGSQAGVNNTTGYDNVFSGYLSGESNTTGDNNIFIGYGAGAINTTGTNDVYIANVGSVTGTESNTIRVGDPTNQNAAYIAGIYGSSVGDNGVSVYVDSAGHLGTGVSSRRFKEQVQDMGDSTSRLFQLRPVTFFYKPQYDDGSHLLQYGLIAEEVAKVYPEMVAYDKDGQPYTVKYQYLAPMLLNELQKQHAVVATQQDVINTQQQQVNAQQQQVQAQQQQIERMQERLSRLESLIARK